MCFSFSPGCLHLALVQRLFARCGFMDSICLGNLQVAWQGAVHGVCICICILLTSKHTPCAGSARASQSAKATMTARVSFLCQTRQQQKWAVTKHLLTLPPLRLTLNCLMTPLGNMMMLMRICMNRGGISTPEVNASTSLSMQACQDHHCLENVTGMLDKTALHLLGPR